MMSFLQAIFNFFAIWFLISIPASLFFGWFMSIRDCPPEEQQDGQYKRERRPPDAKPDAVKRLDEAS
ncbi:MAG: hypothetical protein ACFE0Q_14045 [Anaerolineae bacterium]